MTHQDQAVPGNLTPGLMPRWASHVCFKPISENLQVQTVLQLLDLLYVKCRLVRNSPWYKTVNSVLSSFTSRLDLQKSTICVQTPLLHATENGITNLDLMLRDMLNAFGESNFT